MAGRKRWLLLLAAVVLVGYGAATLSTRPALGGSVLTGAATGGVAPVTAAELELSPWVAGPARSHGQVLRVSARPGGFWFTFDLHNGGAVPVTVTRVTAAYQFVSDVSVQAVGQPGWRGSLAGPGAVTIWPGSSAIFRLTAATRCAVPWKPAWGDMGWSADADSLVIVHYRALALPMSQTISLTAPVVLYFPSDTCVSR